MLSKMSLSKNWFATGTVLVALLGCSNYITRRRGKL